MRTVDLTPRSRRRFGAIGAALVAGAALASYLAARDTHPGSTYLTATFGRAGEGLDDRSDVKIRGVKVGQVASVRLTPQGKALVRIRLDHGVHAPTTSEAAISPLSAFGPKFVDLRPGQGEGRGPYLHDGGTIAKTSDPQDLNDIAAPTVDLLDALGPNDIATIMRSLGTGLDGRGAELAGLVDDSSKLLGTTARRSGDLGSIIGNGGALAGTAARHADEIGKITDDLSLVAPTLTKDPGQFDELLGGLDESSRTLTQILAANPKAPGRVLDAFTPAAGVLYKYRDYFPDLISSSGLILTQLAGIANIPGPHGTLLSRVTIHINPSNALCESLPGICGPIEPAVPNKPNPPKGGN
ncbi:MCE family protein [Actinomadura sp. LD22]|uniref:MCE family protein n=1 Tax=Actinomadura physcomitrii TaxID=2650748 RepID=A0A6I4MIT1_9ACTN|nr:MlaD family protein [Actinomadura physcomitrii]MWA02519.1 MCE family protein [Actinomadura physcomitrii]